MKKFTTIAMCTVAVLGSIQFGALTFAADIPKLQNIGNPALEQQLNQELEKKNINELDEKAKKQITTNYEQKFNDGKIVSFVVTTTETSASSEIKKFFYNFEIATGKAVTLQGLLGDDYKEKINQSIHQQIEQRMKSDENQIFFGFTEDEKEMGILGFQGIQDNQNFYINKDGNVVIVFDQFEIAPGYMGTPEFEITK